MNPGPACRQEGPWGGLGEALSWKEVMKEEWSLLGQRGLSAILPLSVPRFLCCNKTFGF